MDEGEDAEPEGRQGAEVGGGSVATSELSRSPDDPRQGQSVGRLPVRYDMTSVPKMRTWLLCWDDVPEAIIVAKDDDVARGLVYDHDLKLVGEALKAKQTPRGPVDRWTWRELPTIGALDA